MAYTLTEADKYSQNQLLSGVVETIVKESPMLGRLPFIEVTGNALKYLRENAMAPAAWFAAGDTWTEGTQTVTEVTVALKILGGDADVDKFLQQSRSNPNDLEAESVIAKSKGLAHEWEDVTVYGDTGADPKKFDGLHKLVPAGQQVHAGSGATGGATRRLHRRFDHAPRAVDDSCGLHRSDRGLRRRPVLADFPKIRPQLNRIDRSRRHAQAGDFCRCALWEGSHCAFRSGILCQDFVPGDSSNWSPPNGEEGEESKESQEEKKEIAGMRARRR